MYCTAKVDMPEYFRVGLIQFMSAIRRTIAEEIHKRDEKYELGKYLLLFLFYSLMCKIMYYSPNYDCVFPGLSVI